MESVFQNQADPEIFSSKVDVLVWFREEVFSFDFQFDCVLKTWTKLKIL